MCDRPSYYVRACSLFKASLLSETRKIFLTKSLFGSTQSAFFVCVQLRAAFALHLTRLTSKGNIRMGRQHHSYVKETLHLLCCIKIPTPPTFLGDDRSLSLFLNTPESQQEKFRVRSSLTIFDVQNVV
jgi:hypothetical protein